LIKTTLEENEAVMKATFAKEKELESDLRQLTSDMDAVKSKYKLAKQRVESCSSEIKDLRQRISKCKCVSGFVDATDSPDPRPLEARQHWKSLQASDHIHQSPKPMARALPPLSPLDFEKRAEREFDKVISAHMSEARKQGQVSELVEFAILREGHSHTSSTGAKPLVWILRVIREIFEEMVIYLLLN
jgi:chromosome segregation ATPase